MALIELRRRRVIRLVLQVARDGVAQTHLETLLSAAEAALAGHRQELRMAKALLATSESASALKASRAK
jgi:hypothetical protein